MSTSSPSRCQQCLYGLSGGYHQRMQNDIGTIDGSELNDSHFIDYVTKVIRKFSEQNCGRRASLKNNKFEHIDIELLKDEQCSWIRLTNCGRLHNSNCLDIINKLDLLSCKTSAVELCEISVFVYFKTAKNDHEIVYDLQQMENGPIISEMIQFPHLKEYLSIKIEHKSTKKGIKQFIDNLIKYLDHLRSLYPNIKYTFRTNHDKLLYINQVELDHTYTQCRLISSAITRILRLSLNMDFRNECFELLDIDHSEMADDAIMNKLLPLLHDNYQM